MRRYLGLVLACVLAAISASVLAMGLGEIRLNSYLNQRLDAEIELVSAAADEIESLEIRLADPAVFERYGLERTALLNTLQFRVVRRPNGTAFVKVTSSEPIREPFLTLLVVADWSRGRLMREYTLLIDPPTFAGREQAAPAVQVPAQPVTPVPQPRTEEPVVSREPVREPVEPARSEEVQTGDVITIPPLEADAEQVAPIRREPVQAEPEMGGSYGPIQRNETLWGIAQRLRPDESVTVNQMMLALYRANPEAFQGNINRLKAGYILRIPEYSEISSLARRDAFNEVKRQNEEWRAGSRAPAPPSVDVTEQPVEAEPELSLVAPEEDIPADDGLGIGAGGESEDIDLGSEDPLELAEDDTEQDAVDLGIEDESADRLLDVEDESLQALQEQDELLESGEMVEDATEESAELPPLTGEQAETGGEPVAEETQQTVEPAIEGQEPAETAEAQPEQQRPAVVPVPVREPSLVEKVTNFVLSPLGLGIVAVVILVLLLAGVLVMRKRRDAEKSRTAAAMAEWDGGEGDDATVITFDEDDTAAEGGRATDDVATVFSHGMEHEDTGTTRLDEDSATQMLETPGRKAAPVDFTETVVGGQQAVTLDDNDPLSEADFHMAYGLYDQAAEVVRKAVERDPSRKDYLAKLAEIHFAGNDTEGFLDAARRLKALAGPGDADWDNVAIMGQQIAPNDELFATRGSTASVDLDFSSAAEEYGEAAPSQPAPIDDSVDFDLELDADKPAPAAADDSLDFDLDLGNLDTSTEEPAQPDLGAGEPADDDFDFDLGELDEGASEGDVDRADAASEAAFNDEQTQTEFDKALEELSAFVDTNLPEQDAGDAVSADDDSSKLNLDDYSFDEDAGSLEDELAAGGEDEEDIGEIGTKLDLARAYIDMGDPDGARGILEEVLSDGDTDQQKEARELLDQLS